MRGDFSRIPPDSGHYSAVLMQQGRVLVDADWNASTGTSLWAQRALAADVIGPHGGPRHNLGFRPTPIDHEGHFDLELNPGVYYVDAIRCELPARLVPTGHDGMPWNQQPYPIALGPVELPLKPYLVYLDVWERHVGVLEDGTLREVALNGSDTTTRRQVVWQVRVITYPADHGTPSGDTFPLSDWRVKLRGEPPRLRATTAAPELGQDPRLAPLNAGFRGAENQLYRVEIVSGAGDTEAGDPALFVWSRENGSVAATWTDTTGNRLHVVGVGHDRHGFTPGDWIELTWDTLEFAGVAGTRVQLTAADGAVLTIDPDTASGPIEPDPARRPHAKIRRWDQRDTDATPLVKGAVEVVESNTEWIPLENGVWIQFSPGDTDTPYRVGDYWTMPARTSTADIDWPYDTNGEPLPLPPQGPQRQNAPLAYVTEKNVCLQKAFRPLATSC